MIKRKRFQDQNVERVSYTFEDGKYVFTLRTHGGDTINTKQDVDKLQDTYKHKFGEKLVGFRFEVLSANCEIIEASGCDIRAGSTLKSNQGQGTAGLVVRWVTDKLSSDALTRWAIASEDGASICKFAIVTAEHVVRNYSDVQAPILHVAGPMSAAIAQAAGSLLTRDVAIFADVREIKRFTEHNKVSTYYSDKCENVHYDIALCTIQQGITVDVSKANMIKDTFTRNNTKPVKINGEVQSIEREKVRGNKCMQERHPFYLLGRHNRSFGLIQRWESLRGVNYIVCDLMAQEGDSGGLLFEILLDGSINAVGILSKVEREYDDINDLKNRKVIRQEAWFTPLSYLNLDVIELAGLHNCSAAKTPTGTTSSGATTTESENA